MRLTTAAAIFAVALICTAKPALAQESFPGKEFGGWHVYGENGECFMEKDIGGGTTAVINTVVNEQMLEFLALNDAWKDFELHGDVDGHIKIGTVSVDAEGVGLENGFLIYTVLESGSALDTIASAGAVTFSGGNRTVSFSLANTREAVAYLRACDATTKRD
jgi:hypothetical protein